MDNKIDLTSMEGTYDADNIGGSMSPIKAIQRKPSRYLGSSDGHAIMQQLKEIVENANDETEEVIRRYKEQTGKDITLPIDIFLYEDGSVRVRDYGRGMPVKPHKVFKVPVIQALLEYDAIGGKGYDISGYKSETTGVHGAGACAVNATAEFFDVTSNRLDEKKSYHIRYEGGVLVTKLEEVGDITKTKVPFGTDIHFKYNEKYLTPYYNRVKMEYPFDILAVQKLLKGYSYTTSGIQFNFVYKLPNKDTQREVYKSSDYTFDKLIGMDKAIKNNHNYLQFAVEGEDHDYSAEYMCVKGTNGRHIILNRIILERGSHADAFEMCIKSEVERQFTLNGTYDPHVPIDLVFRALKLNYVTNLKMKNPEFTGQKKTEFKSDKAYSNLVIQIGKFLRTNPKAQAFIHELYTQQLPYYQAKVDAYKKRKEAKKPKLKLAKDTSVVSGLIKNLTYPDYNDTRWCDLIVVEGSSASLNVKQVVNPYQAVFEIKGYMPNVLVRNCEVLAQDVDSSFYHLCRAISLGWRRIIVLTDGDADGSAIKLLILQIICKYYMPYVTQKRLYIISAPLYTFNAMVNGRITSQFAYSEQQKETIIKKYPNTTFVKYKGLNSASLSIVRGLLNYDKDSKNVTVVDPTTISEGLMLLDRLMGKSNFTRLQFFKNNFATPELGQYLDIRDKKGKLQTVSLANNKIEEYSEELDFNDVLNEEDIMSESDIFHQVMSAYESREQVNNFEDIFLE